MSKIGKAIQRERERAGLSRSDLAHRLEKDASFKVRHPYVWLHRVEDGSRKVGDPEHLVIVARAIGVPVERLMGGA